MKVQNNNPIDILTATVQAEKGKGKDGFKNMLDAMLQEMENAPSTLIGSQKPDRPVDNGKEKPEAKTDDATLAAAAQAAANPQAARESDPAENDGDPAREALAAAQNGRQAVTQDPADAKTPLPIPPLPGEEQPAAPGGDILSAQVTVTPLEDEADILPAAAPIPLDVQEEDRLGAMLGQKQQELAGITGQVPEDAEAGLPEAPEGIPPELEAEIPLPPDAESEEPPEIPLEDPSEAKPADETPQTRVHVEPEQKMTEQKTLSELPQSDRAILEMRDAKPAAPRKPEPEPTAATAPEPKPEPVRAPETRQPEPARPEQPDPRLDQMEQVRMEVTRNLDQNRMEFRMQLQPEELGKVNVRMVLESGRLAVEIMAATPKAAELLAKQAESLMQSLRLQQLDVQSVNVVTESQSADRHMNGAFTMLGGQAQDGGDGRPSLGRPGAHQTESDIPGDGEDTDPRSPEALLDYEI